MSKINMQVTFSAAAAVGAVVLFSLLSLGGRAEAASGIFSCQGTNASQVTSCCDKYVKKNGMPHWMIEAHASCKQATACASQWQSRKKRCFIHIIEILKEGDGPTEDGGQKVPRNSNPG